MATVFLADNFTETADANLSDHTPPAGGSWSAFGSPYSANVTVLASEGRVTGSLSTASALFTHSAVAPSADVLVQATVRFTSSTGKRAGILARYSASGPESGYLVYYDGNAWLLRKAVAGVGTDLGSYTVSTALNTDYQLRLEVYESWVTVTVDGVARIAVNDTSVPQAGRVGLLVRSGGRLDNFSASTLDAQPVRWSQGAVEVVIQPQPDVRLTQLLVEVLSQPMASSRLSQVAVEVLVLPFAPARWSQAAVEVLWRDARLAGDLAPQLVGHAQLDQGKVLSGQSSLTFTGAAALELGTDLGQAHGTAAAYWTADLQATHGLHGSVNAEIRGSAELLMGQELQGDGQLRLIANAQLYGAAVTSSGFWLLF